MASLHAQASRLVAVVPEPLGWYLHPSYVDHRAFADVVTGGPLGLHGVVFDPLHDDRHSEPRDLTVGRNRDATPDPKPWSWARLAGSTNAWLRCLGRERMHTLSDFDEVNGYRIADSMSGHDVEEGYAAVLAPAHDIGSAYSAWLDVDARTT